MEFTIHQVSDLTWPFSDKPGFPVKDGTYQRTEYMDPYPCYAHPAGMVKGLTDRLNELMPLSGRVDYYLPEYESLERVNGWASQHSWSDGTEFEAHIVLAGKRIPLHPAMTRYLTVHEYGHVVQFWVEKMHQVKNLIEAYGTDIRQYKSDNKYYGGRTWHKAMGEIFANDFRIAVCKTEAEFWPHPVTFPLHDAAVRGFWATAIQDWGEALALLPSVKYQEKKK